MRGEEANITRARAAGRNGGDPDFDQKVARYVERTYGQLFKDLGTAMEKLGVLNGDRGDAKKMAVLQGDLVKYQSYDQRNTAGGYAGLNKVSRTVRGADTVDDLIVDDAAHGLILKSPNGHYWRLSVSNVGVVLATDLGTTKP